MPIPRPFPVRWEDLAPVPDDAHDPALLHLLEIAKLPTTGLPVVLSARYTRGARWTKAEEEALWAAWQAKYPTMHIAVAFQRNPQDVLTRLMDRAAKEGVPFVQHPGIGSAAWGDLAVQAVAQALFAQGLAAWKIGALFRIDFEFIEKRLYKDRTGYGHEKKNPFAINSDHKQVVNDLVLSTYHLPIENVLEPFAGEGRMTQIILQHAAPNCRLMAVEKDADTFARAQRVCWPGDRVRWVLDDNLNVLANLDNSVKAGDPRVKGALDLIDLDPFATCHEQVPYVWPLLAEQALLFVTFGGEYRRSFIGSNREGIARRYGFTGGDLDNKTYLEEVPRYFLGWVALSAARQGRAFQVLRAVRYANYCRFWLQLNPVVDAMAHLRAMTTQQHGGWRWETLTMPRFAEVRRELDARDGPPA